MSDQPQLTSSQPQYHDLIDRLIDSQQQLTAVERFSQRYQTVTTPSLEPQYRDLIPLDSPSEDEQYAFEVDLDACSGCKSCVAACHNLNGLDDGELWRSVGMLVGGTDVNPALQHVTVACHHCLEPACLAGCPVNAYDKDPTTGIVSHLDDQCIGCKYCMLMCPYDVPTYSKRQGIVRKCNMCADRLAIGEAPACVQSCPNQAIKITKVSRDETISQCEADQLVPGAPDVHLTLPTTRYSTQRVLPRNLLPDDYYVAKPLHAHFPLVFMLTLTQMAFGIFGIGLLVKQSRPLIPDGMLAGIDVAGLAVLMAGLNIAIFHLGRPLKAYRALAGLATSWLSREIAGFNLFVFTAMGLVAWGIFPQLADWTGISRDWMATLATIGGAVAIGCSAMLYIVTKRPLWTGFRTFSLFLLTSAILGIATTILGVNLLCSGTSFCAGLGGEMSTINDAIFWELFTFLVTLLVMVVVAKLTIEASIFVHLKSHFFTPQQHAARLMTGELQWPTAVRYLLAIVGGVMIPLLLLAEVNYSQPSGFPTATLTLASISLLLLTVGELLERYLFFAVSVARRMPGAPN